MEGGTPLLERDDELGRLLAGALAARSGQGGAFVVEGEAGIGKSRLLDELAARADGMRTLPARGTPLERELPFGVAARLLEPAVRDAGEAIWEGAAALAVPLLRGGAEPTGEEASVRRFALLQGLHGLTVNLALAGPLLLLLDDAHWADELSLRYLAYLGERLGALPVCAVVATRPAGARPAAVLDELLRSPHAERLRPRTLSGAAVGALVHRRFPRAQAAVAGVCLEATGGNPLLVEELLAEAGRRGLDLRSGTVEPLRELASERLVRRVAARVDALDAPGAAPLARATAVLGDRSDLGLVARLAGLELDEAGVALDALVDAGVHARTGRPTFAHPLLAAAVLEGIPAGARAGLHLRAARLLGEAGAAPARVAAQLDAAPVSHEPWALDALLRAGADALRGGAPAIAVRRFARAVSEAADPPARGAALAALGRAELTLGRRDGVERLAAAAELAAEPEERARLLLEFGRALGDQGDLTRAATVLRSARAQVDADGALAGELDAAWALVARHVPALREQAVERTAQVVRRAGATPSERALLAAAASQAAFAGEPHATVAELARHALGEEDPAPDDWLSWAVALSALGWAGEIETVAAAADDGVAIARRHGSLVGYATASYTRSYPLRQSGRIPDAALACRQAVELHPSPDWTLLPFACVHLAWAELDLAEPAAATAAIERCEPDARWADAPVFILVAEARGRVALARGEPARALELLLDAGRRAAEALMPNPVVVPWREAAVVAALQLGDRDLAATLASEELALAGAFGAPAGVAAALRSSGLAAGGRRGVELLHEAVAASEGTSARLEHVRSVAELGAALRRAGRRAEARAPLRRALELAERIGAVALERRVRDELAATGARPRRPDATGTAALTPSEWRVAELAADGLTNRQIAQTLFVTPKAVQFHLRNVYRKLDVVGRDGLAKALRPRRGGP